MSESLPVPVNERLPVARRLPAALAVGGGANELVTGTLQAEFIVERATRRFVTLRLRVGNGAAKRIRCQVFIGAESARRPKQQLLRLSVEPGEVIDAAVVVRRNVAAHVAAEFTGGGMSALVTAPDAFATPVAPLRRAALAGAAAFAGLTVISSGYLALPFGTSPHAALATPGPGGILGNPPRRVAAAALAPVWALPAPVAAAAVPVSPRTLPSAAAPGPAGAFENAAALPPLISAASLDRTTVSGGEPILVSYTSSSSSGEVRLLDDRGTIRAEALLSRSGNSILVAPDVDVEQDFRVSIDAGDASRHEERELPIRVVPGNPAAPPTSEEQAVAVETGRPFVLDQKSVVAGDDLHLTIVRHEPAMRVTMLDQDGNPIASEPVDPTRTRIALRVPRGMYPEMYTVDVSYVDANGEEHSVTPVNVR